MAERIPSDPGAFPKIELMPVVDRLIAMGLTIGRFVGNHLVWEPRPTASDHYRSPGASMKATHQAEWQRQMDYTSPTEHTVIIDDRPPQLNRWDSEGTYLEAE